MNSLESSSEFLSKSRRCQFSGTLNIVVSACALVWRMGDSHHMLGLPKNAYKDEKQHLDGRLETC